MHKEEYITKEYFEKISEKNSREIKQHMTDLTSGFNEKVKGIADQLQAVDERLNGSINSLDERLTGSINALDERLTGSINALDERLTGSINSLDNRFTTLETKVDRIQDDITLIKDVLVEKTDINETRRLEKRMTRLEVKLA